MKNLLLCGVIYAVQTKNTKHQKVMKRVVEKSTQNVNGNAGIPRITKARNVADLL